MELDLIERIAARVAMRPGVAIGIGDDAAVLAGSPATVATHDMLVDGVHFLLDATSFEDLGHKALAVNLSDLAAMGAAPVACLVGLGIPADGHIGPDDVSLLYDGMEALAGVHGVTIAGGDIVAAPSLILSVTALGRLASPDAAVRRSGANPGDEVFVTGRIGAAAAGLLVARGEASSGDAEADARLLGAHCRPVPRVAAGPALAAAGATAMLDCSDGLALDLRRIARASRVAATIHLEHLPVDPDAARLAASTSRDAQILAATGGDDYELIVTAPPGSLPSDLAGLAITRIGEIGPGPAALHVMREGREIALETLGWEHRFGV